VLCAESLASYAEVVGEYRMAWQKLRSHKSPGQSGSLGSHSGAAPDGARSHGAAPDAPWPARDPAGPPPSAPDLGAPALSVPAPSAPSESLTAPGTAAPGAPGTEVPTAWPEDEIATDESPADAAEVEEESSDVPFWGWGKGADADDVADSPVRDEAGATRAGASRAAAAADGGPPSAASRPVVTPVEPAGDQQPGIGQRRGNLAHLSADPRKKTWQLRAIIAIIVGVLFAFLVSWQLGLTLAIVVAIADTIYRSKRGLPGRRSPQMTGAQRQTRRQLAKLGRAGYRAMHGNLIPQSEEQIDHLVVGPAGVFAIDSESWDKRLIVRTKNARQLWHGPFSMKERLEHARWESQRAGEMLSGVVGSPVTVRPAMAVYGPRIPWDVVTIRDVDVFSGPRLRKYLRRKARQDGSRALTAPEVERIYSAANQAFPHLNVSVTASRLPTG
jgi:Nuclease-related domain